MAGSLPFLGVGLSYRWELNPFIARTPQGIDWLEVTPEHFMPVGPDAEARLALLARRFPLVGHGLELSIGSDGAEPDYRAQVKRVLEVSKAVWHGDHLCFTWSNAQPVRALTPLPFHEGAVEAAVRNIRDVRRELAVPFALENIAYYFANPLSTMEEAEFLSRVVTQADCGLVLDLHNVYTNSVNHRFDPYRFLDRLPLDRVVQIHIAGGERYENVYIDTHSSLSPDEVWRMLEYVVPRCAVRGINFEMDSRFPPFPKLLEELARARQVLDRHGASAA